MMAKRENPGLALQQTSTFWNKHEEYRMLSGLKTFVETFAILMAGLFFGWKWLSGSLIANMNIEPIIERKTKNDASNKDYLMVTIKLTKGDRASVEITGLNVTITEEGSNSPLISQNLTSPSLPNQNRNVRLSPGEATQFSYMHEVSHDKAYNIEIYVTGKSIIIPKLAESEDRSQWKASIYSVPI